VFAGLLVAAGVAKGIAPQAAAGALRGMRLPSSTLLVRLLGLGEVAIGLSVLTGTALASAGMAFAYGGFAVFVAIALYKDLPIGSCGCFGKDDTPPTWVHVTFNVVGTGVAFATFANPIGSPAGWSADLGALTIPYVILTAAATFFSYLLLAELPRTLALTSDKRAMIAVGGGS